MAETYVSYINKTLEKHKVVFVMNQLLETFSGSGNDILSQCRIQSERDTTGCTIVNGAVFLPVRRRTSLLLGYFNPIKLKSISVAFRSIKGSHSGGCEEYYLPRYNPVQFVESLPTFQNNISLQSSGSKNKLTNTPACKKVARRLNFLKDLGTHQP
jgi:hypothetical protein